MKNGYKKYTYTGVKKHAIILTVQERIEQSQLQRFLKPSLLSRGGFYYSNDAESRDSFTCLRFDCVDSSSIASAPRYTYLTVCKAS